MNDEAWLVLRGVPAHLWACALIPQHQVAGRSVDCAIHIAHDTVSRRHAELWQDEAEACIRDLASSNGTFVNGRKVTESFLEIGDCLQLGEVQLELVPESAVKESTAVYQAKPTALVVSAANDVASARLQDLSPAQVRVLRLLLHGYSEKKVAADLHISRHTVHTHVKQIYRQLGVRSRAELMAALLTRTTNKLDD